MTRKRRLRDGPAEPPRLGAWDLFFLAAVALFTPIRIVAITPEGGDLSTALLAALAIWVVLIVIAAILLMAGLRNPGVTYSVAVVGFMFTTVGLYIYTYPLGRLGLVLTALAIGLIVYRLQNLAFISWALTWGAFAVLLAPLVQVAPDVFSVAPSHERLHVGETVSSGRDVVVIVADAYPSTAVLAEFYSYDNFSFIDGLEELGVLAWDVGANYSLTPLSVASVLHMDYVAGDQESLDSAELSALFDMLGGENRFSSILASSGYRLTYVESGWSGTECGLSIDVCIAAPWPGETYFDIALRSILRDLPGFVTGTQFSRGTIQAFSWLDADLPVLLDDDESDFVYIHILAPHPPLFFDADCQVDRRPELGGFGMSLPGIATASDDERRRAYVEQVQCVNGVVVQAAIDVTESGGVFVFFGDHGPDGQQQLYARGDEWTESQVRERFGTLAAISAAGCDVVKVPSLVDLLPQIVECLGGEDAPDPRELRSFVVGNDADGVRVYEYGVGGSG